MNAGQRLDTRFLLAVTLAIAAALAINRAIEKSRFPADQYYEGLTAAAAFNPHNALVAAVYGVCLTVFLLRWRTDRWWTSPGKTLAFLFASMALLNWGLDAVAAAVVHKQMQSASPIAGELDLRGYVLAWWYRQFAAAVGYPLGMVMVSWALYRTRQQAWQWRLAWGGFLIFSILISAAIHWDATRALPLLLRRWYFEASLGLPVVLLVLAAAITFCRRQPLDWWTTVTVPLVALAWAAGVGVKIVTG